MVRKQVGYESYLRLKCWEEELTMTDLLADLIDCTRCCALFLLLY